MHVSDSQLLPYETSCATSNILTPEDRQKDVAPLQFFDRVILRMWAISLWLLLFPLLFFTTQLQKFAIPYGVVMMGLWIIGMLTLAATRNATNWHVRTSLLTSVLLAAFAAMSFGPWTFMWLVVRVAVAAVIAVLQIGLLLWTLRTSPSAEFELQVTFYATLKSVCCISTIESLAFLLKSFVVDSPPMGCFACAVTCLLCFACATFVAAMAKAMNDPRSNKWNEPTFIFSCDAVSDYENETCNGCCEASFPTALSFILAIAFVLLWPSFDGYDWSVGAAYPMSMALVMFILERHFLAACRFHILPHASIVVETMNKSYIYGQVLHAEVEPTAGTIPKHTETCHVYCASSPTERVKIQLSGERLLYMTPQHPAEFAHAIRGAIR